MQKHTRKVLCENNWKLSWGLLKEKEKIKTDEVQPPEEPFFLSLHNVKVFVKKGNKIKFYL